MYLFTRGMRLCATLNSMNYLRFLRDWPTQTPYRSLGCNEYQVRRINWLSAVGLLILAKIWINKNTSSDWTWKANPVTISCSSYHVLKHLVHQENWRLVKTWTANAYTQMLQNTQCVSDSARYECGEHWTLPRFPRLHLLEAVLPSPTHKMSLFSALAPWYPVNQRAPRSTVPRANDVFSDGILWEPKTGFHVLGKRVDRSIERLTMTKFCPGIETLLNWIPRHSTKNKLIFK